jgi:tRNAThr (cytosine32-N3)-methyltransferase
MSDPEAAARAALDAVHASEPSPVPGKPDARAYADHVERWMRTLVPQPSLALRLAARAQHLERWAIPRSDYPADKPGYFAWRKAVHRRQGARAQEILLAAGIDAGTAARVDALVAKATPRDDTEGQALEDAACLTFFTTELGAFAAAHADYTSDKYLDILRKTLRKMSTAGRAEAARLTLPEPLAGLMRTALG